MNYKFTSFRTLKIFGMRADEPKNSEPKFCILIQNFFKLLTKKGH